MGMTEIIVLMLAAAGIGSVACIITKSILKMIDAAITGWTMRKFLDECRVWYNDCMSDLVKIFKDFES